MPELTPSRRTQLRYAAGGLCQRCGGSLDRDGAYCRGCAADHNAVTHAAKVVRGVVRYYRDGRSLAWIAARYGLYAAKIRRILIAEDVPIRPAGTVPRETEPIVVARAAGRTLADIGRELGVSRQAVHSLLKRNRLHL